MSASNGPRQWAAGDGNVLISHVSDSQITVTIGGGEPRSVGLRPGWWELPPGLGSVSLATLLKADVGLVPFVDVGNRLRGLTRWARSAETISATVIAGSAGRGKTRLAGELCKILSIQPDSPWLTGFLRRDAEPAEIEALAATPVPRCVVLDYSEAKADVAANLVGRLMSSAAAATPVRLVLLTRATIDGSHDVRALLRGRSTAFDALLDTAEPQDLAPPQWGEPKTRRKLFKATAKVVAHRLEEPPPPVPATLDGEVYDRPLTIVLAAALACYDKRALPTQRRSLLDRFVEVEAQHWRRTADRLGVAASDTLLRALAGYATLAGAANGLEATEMLARLPLLADTPLERRHALAEWMHAAYPGTRYWNPVEPDLLGEHLVATTVGGQEDVVAATLSERPPVALQGPLELLIRAMGNYPERITAWSSLVSRRLESLVEAARDQAAATTADELFQPSLADTIALALTQIQVELNLLERAAGHVESTSIVLNPLQTVIHEQLVSRYRDLSEDDPTRLPNLAKSLNNLSVRVSEAGRGEEGLAAIEQAATIYRQLAEANPTAYLTDLATSLNNLSVQLGEAGRRDEALTAIEEAVTIRRLLAQADPAACLPDLATSLNNLSVRLRATGRREEALAAIKEAVKILRQLAETNAPAYLFELSTSLNNLSNQLGEARHRDEALAAIDEAVTIRQQLAETKPAAYLPDLATSLNNLSIRLGDAGRREEALAAIKEAVKILRQLVQANSAAYLPYLATSLNNLSGRLGATGRREEALATSGEAVRIRRKLAQANPTAYLPDLATSLHNLSVQLGRARRDEEALAASGEAVRIRRQLAQADPAAYMPDFSESLKDFSIRLAEAGRREEALTAIEEAVTIREQLAQPTRLLTDPT